MRSRPRREFVLLLVVCASLPPAAPGRAEPNASAVLLAWPTGPLETRVVFDEPLSPSEASRLVGRSIRFDLQHRGLASWRRHGAPALASPRGRLNVTAARLGPDRRTVILTTDPHAREAVYRLDGEDAAASPAVAYDLSGVAVTWTPEGAGEGEKGWEGWWPEFDPATSRNLTQKSSDHEQGFEFIGKAGVTTLESLVTLPKGRVVLSVVSDAAVEVALNGENPSSTAGGRAEFVVESTGDPLDLFVTVRTERPAGLFSLRATYQADGAAAQPLSRDRTLLPWASPSTAAPAQVPAPPYALTGGDRARGEALFQGDRAKCGGCHRVNGKGGAVGPDLSSVVGRRIEEVYRDIADPSAVVHPDFTAYSVALKDGRVLVGVVRSAGAGSIRVTDAEGKVVEVPQAEIEELRPSGTSIMPVGLVGALGESDVRDLLAYLLTPSRTPDTSTQP